MLTSFELALIGVLEEHSLNSFGFDSTTDEFFAECGCDREYHVMSTGQPYDAPLFFSGETPEDVVNGWYDHVMRKLADVRAGR